MFYEAVTFSHSKRKFEGVRAKQLLTVIIFINFKKAFDSVHRGTPMKIFLAYGIPKAIVDIMGLLYTNMKAWVITPDGMTSYFDMQTGVLQGDMLALYLFIITVDYCMRQAIKSHPEYGFTINPAKSKRIKLTRSVTLNLWMTLHSWQTLLRRQQIS